MIGPEQHSLFDTPHSERVAEEGSRSTSDSGSDILTVEELNRLVGTLLQEELGTVWVEGELSGIRRYRSGGWERIYATLKDAAAEVSIVIWPETLEAIRFELEDGLKVVVEADVSLYARRGTFQLVIRRLRPAGLGERELALQQLKQKLDSEGLFAAHTKQALPAWPFRVGVVTSLQAAALRDFLQVTGRRNPALRILIAPAAVQGDGAAAEIVTALQDLQRVADLDCIVLTRGGGSVEDLWPFNEEIVARAIAACPLPVISAVGHEIDWTISDLVADVRSPTPSAAAELVAWPAAETGLRLAELGGRMGSAVRRRVDELDERVRWFTRAHGFQQMRLLIREQFQRLDEIMRLLPAGLRHRLESAGGRLNENHSRLIRLPPLRLERAAARLEQLRRTAAALGPQATLARGYAIARRPGTGDVIRRAGEIAAGEQLEVLLARGSLEVTVAGHGEGLDRHDIDATVVENGREK